MNFNGWFSLIGACALVWLTGCSLLPQEKFYSGYSIIPLKYDANSAGAILIRAIVKEPSSDLGLVDSVCLDVPVAEDKTAACQRQRNVALMTLLTESDNMCQEHLKTIFGNEASFNILTGTVTNVASGAATITGGVAAKSALASVAFLSNAERSLVNETVYKNILVTAVTKKIGEARTNSKATISAKFSSDIGTYSVLSSVNDIIGYHETCAFMYGLQKALDEGTQPNPESKKIKLEQDKLQLEIALQTRTNRIGAAAAVTDEGAKGIRARIEAIEETLLSMVKGQR